MLLKIDVFLDFFNGLNFGFWGWSFFFEGKILDLKFEFVSDELYIFLDLDFRLLKGFLFCFILLELE